MLSGCAEGRAIPAWWRTKHQSALLTSLARRLPSVPDKPLDSKTQGATANPAQPNDTTKPKPNTVIPKPQGISATEGTTAEGTVPKKVVPATKSAQSVIKVSDDVTKQPTPPAPKPAVVEPKPQTEEDRPQ